MSRKDQRLITIRTAKTDRDGVTDPIRKRPPRMSRREWRDLQREAYRVTRKQELINRHAEAALPEAAKIDRRLHDAGLYSHRDLGRVRAVQSDRILIVGA